MRRVLRVARNIALALLALEVVLQIASFAGREVLTRGSVESRADGEIVILAVGDSHTFGAPVEPEDSYPSQLQKALAQRFPSRSFRVVNLGLPGTNSAFVANRLERQMLQVRPDLVILWVGVNNLWNVLETESWGNSHLGSRIRRGLLRSKLYRMAVVTWHTRSLENSLAERKGRRVLDADGRPEWSWKFGDEEVRPAAKENPDSSEINAGLAFDHDRIVATAIALETPVLFINYPFEYLGIRNTIAASGDRLGVAVIDSQQSMKRAITDGRDWSELLVRAAGPHPKGLLYRYVVEDMMPLVVDSLDTSLR